MNNKISIRLTRDSVCAGDDTNAPHERRFTVPLSAKIQDLIEKVWKIKYAAQIEGGKATWVLKLNSVPIAVFAQQWRAPKSIGDANKQLLADDPNTLKMDLCLAYRAQTDPETVYRDLAGKLNTK